MSTRATYLITSWPIYDVTLNWCLAKRGQVKYIYIYIYWWNLEKRLIPPNWIKMLDVARNPAMQFSGYCLFNVSIYSPKACIPASTKTRGPFHKWFFHYDSNSMAILFCSHPSCSEVIALKFCTLHDSSLSCHVQNFVALWYARMELY